MTYSDTYNIRTTSVKFNDVADAIDGSITRGFGGTTSGTSTAYICGPTPAWVSYDAAASITIIPHVSNAAGSPAVTINISGLGTKEIKRGGANLVAGVMVAGIPTILIYTGVHFEVIAAANALLLDGTNSMISDLNLGGFKPVNIAAGTAAAPAICAGNDINTGIFSAAADEIGIATNGVEKIRINAVGTIISSRTGSGTDIEFIKYESGAQGSVLHFKKSKSATIGTNTIVSNGDALGEIYFVGANGTGYTNAAAIIAQVDGTPGASNDMPGRLLFYTTADGSGTLIERMRIDNDGRIAVNGSTTSPGNGQFYAVSSTTNRAAGRFYTSGTGDDATPALFLDKQSTVNTTAQVFIQCTINAQGTAQGQINANGASQLAFGTFSDQRLKENIEDLPNQLNSIISLRPVEFDYKNGSGHQIGFIAQEVQDIYPDLVNADAQGMLNLSGLGKWEARLVKAIQELNAKVEALYASVS